MSKKIAFIIMGPQGSGKSTQTEIVAQHFHLPIFESGAQLRAFARKDSPLAQKIKSQMAAGQLADNPTLWQIFQNYLRDHPVTKAIILDGFPRTLDQCQLLAQLAEENHWQIQGIYLQISDETATKRLAQRYTIVDGKKVTREDDQPAAVRRRLALFHQRTQPVLDWLNVHHQLITVDGEPSADQVTKAVIAVMQPLVEKNESPKR